LADQTQENGEEYMADRSSELAAQYLIQIQTHPEKITTPVLLQEITEILSAQQKQLELLNNIVKEVHELVNIQNERIVLLEDANQLRIEKEKLEAEREQLTRWRDV